MQQLVQQMSLYVNTNRHQYEQSRPNNEYMQTAKHFFPLLMLEALVYDPLVNWYAHEKKTATQQQQQWTRKT